MPPSTSEESVGSPRASFDPFDENQARSVVNRSTSIRNERDEALRKIKLLERNLSTLRVSAAKTARELELTNQEIVESARYRLEAESWTDSEEEGKAVGGADNLLPDSGGRERLQVLEESFTGLVSGLKRLDNIRHSAAGGRKAEESDRLKQATEGYCVQTKALLRRSIAATDTVVADMLRAKKDATRQKAKNEQLERTVYKLDAMLKQNHNRQQRHPQARILLRKWILRQKRTLITAVVRCWFTRTRQVALAREAAEKRIRNAQRYKLTKASFTYWRREVKSTKELENMHQYLPASPVDAKEAADASQIAALEDEIVLLKAARDQLEADKAGLRVECERASARLREREDELGSAGREHGVTHLEAELIAEKERSATLEARLIETVAKVAEFQALLEKNRKDAGSAEEECVASSELEVRGVTLETEELRERVEQLKQQLKNAEESQRGSEFEDATSSGKKMPSSSVFVTRDSHEDMEQQLILLKEDHDKQAIDLQDREMEIRRLHDELDALRVETNCLGDVNKELRATLEGLQSSEAEVITKLDSAKAQEELQRQTVAELEAKLGETQGKLDKIAVEGKKKEEELTGARDALTAKVMALEFQIKSYEEEKELSQSEKVKVEEELEKLKALLEDARQESARQESAIAASRDETTAKAEEEKHALMEANASLQNDIQEVTANWRKAEEELQRVTELHDRAEATYEEEMESLRIQLKSIRDEHEKSIEDISDSHMKEVEALTDTVETLEAKIREMTVADEAREEALKKEGDESRAVLVEKEEEHSREISNLRLGLELMQKQLDEKKAELVTLSSELDAQAASLRASEEELATEKTQNAEKEERCRQLSDEVNELTAKEADTKERMSRVEEVLEQLESDRIQIEKERDVLIQRLDEAGDSSSLMGQLTDELSKAQAELENVRKENAQKIEEIEALKAEKQAIVEDIWKQEVCLREATEGRDAAKTALGKAEADRMSLEVKYQETQAELNELMKSREEWKDKCSKLNQEVEDTKKALSALREKETTQSRELTRLHESAAELENRLAETLALHEKSFQEVAELKEEVNSLTSALNDKDIEKAALLEDIEKLRHSVAEKETALENLRDELRALQSSSELAEARYNEGLNKAQKDIEILRASAGDEKVLASQIEELKAEATMYEERISELTSQLGEADEEISRLNEQLKTVEAELAEVQASSYKRIEQHRTTLRELEDVRESKESIIVERDTEIARLKDLVSSAEGASDDLKRSLDVLRSRLSEAEAREAEAEGKLGCLEEERKALQRSIADLQEAKEHLVEQAKRGSEYESKYKALEASEELLAERERELNLREARLADIAVNLQGTLSADDVAGTQLDERTQQPDAEIQLRIAETEHELLMKLEDTEKGLAEERATRSSLVARIDELEAKERSLQEQLEIMTVDREEFEQRAHQVELLINEREALITRIERAEADAATNDKNMGRNPTIAEVVAYPVTEQQVEALPKSSGSIPAINTLAFCSHNLSPYITVSSDGMKAVYDCGDAAKDEVMCGVVMTDRPLPYNSSFGYYMEVTITAGASTSLKYSDGLTLGVTTTPPGEVRSGCDSPSSCDEVPETWAVGFDGQIWDPIANDWPACGWCGKDLKAGQKVGLLVSKSPVDQLFILVDGAVVVEGPKNIPTGKELYGVVDLIGSTAAVLLSNPESTPLPPAALEFVPKAVPLSSGRSESGRSAFRLPSRQTRSRNESKRQISSSVAGGSVSGERIGFEMPSVHGSHSFVAPSVSSVGSKFALPSRKAASKHHASSAHSSAGSTSSKLAFPKFSRR